VHGNNNLSFPKAIFVIYCVNVNSFSCILVKLNKAGTIEKKIRPYKTTNNI